MRKFALSLAGAAAALGFAAPAAAQFYPAYAPRSYAYGYGYATPAIAGSMQARVANIRAQVRNLAARGMIRWNRARNLEREAFNLQRSVDRAAWNGISPGERYSLDVRIANLERRVQTAAFRPRHYARYAGYRY
jgi:hypothetical protein